MTRSQLEFLNYQENKRNNMATLNEQGRHNVAVESETKRNNVATLQEQTRTNKAHEKLEGSRNIETKRNNVATLKETSRHNRATEGQAKRDTAAKITTAQITAAASRYGADVSAAASRYNTNTNAKMAKYQADVSAAQKALDRVYETLNVSKTNATNKQIADIRANSAVLVKQLENMQKSKELSQNKKLQIKKLKQDYKIALKQMENQRDIAGMKAFTDGANAFIKAPAASKASK